MPWPSSFPVHCPPVDSINPTFKVYRFVKESPLSAADFASYKEMGKTFSQVKECQACGVSVYTDWQDVLELQGQVPGLRKMKVAEGIPPCGKIKSTPSLTRPNCGYSHHTWWKPNDLEDSHSEFNIV